MCDGSKKLGFLLTFHEVGSFRLTPLNPVRYYRVQVAVANRPATVNQFKYPDSSLPGYEIRRNYVFSSPLPPQPCSTGDSRNVGLESSSSIAREFYVSGYVIPQELKPLYEAAERIRTERFGMTPEWSGWAHPEKIANWACESNNKTIVLRRGIDEAVIGAVTITRDCPKTAPDEMRAIGLQIAKLAVDPDGGGKGHGNRLLREAERYCRDELGARAVYLFWRSQNSDPNGDPLGRLYVQKNGYQPHSSIYVNDSPTASGSGYHHYALKELGDNQ
jgi:ribosomal protein S18 acetylase RimI-like enzyme